MKQKTLKFTSLVFGILLTVALIVNTSVTTYVLWNDRQTASMSPNSRETLNIAVEADLGRPSPLRYFWDLLKSWTTAWYVEGVESTDAISGLTISVTGSNVASQASVDYYIEAVASDASGNSYRFLEGNSTSITVGGASLAPTNQTTVINHLEAMGLSTTQSHTIDYYVYVRAQVTGAVSGETLTSEITKTKFDTVSYQWGTESTTDIAPTLDTHIRESDPTISYSTDTVAYMGWWTDPKYFDTFIIFDLSDYNVVSGTLKLYINGYSGSVNRYFIHNVTSFDSTVTWNTAPTKDTELLNERGVYWEISTWFEFDSSGLDAYLAEQSGGTAYLRLSVENEGVRYYRRFSTMESSTNKPKMSITYLDFSASWYPIPASLVDIPISQELGILLVVAITAGVILQDHNRRKNE